MLLKVGVCFGEMAAAEEASAGRIRRGMGGRQDEVRAVEEFLAFFLSVFAPEQEDDIVVMCGNGLNDGVGQLFPPLLMVRKRLAFTNRQRGVEEENPLASPGDEATVGCRRNAKVGLKFLIDVLKGGRDGDPMRHAEAEAVGLSWTVVWVLPNDDNFDLVKRRQLKSLKDLTLGRKDGVSRPFFPLKKGFQVHEIGFL